MDEYIDDGYSGTTFDRPAVKRLLEDAKNGRINIIVVKDLSVLGVIISKSDSMLIISSPSIMSDL